MEEPLSQSSSEILPLVYDELRRLARNKMQNECAPQTLSATALVHEAYLRVSDVEDDESPSIKWKNKRHFFAAAAEAMRRILIDRARAKARQKRGGDLSRSDWESVEIIGNAQDDEMLAVNEALAELESVNAEAAEIVKLYYFAGMTWVEISKATEIPERTLRRKWNYARAWLRERMDKKFE